jgi:aldehyde dehydrogenase (NAD+)
MGGKNPLIVLDDADLDRAVQIALDGSFFATGQRCTASSRLIVQDGIHDRFVAALAERVASLRVGDALDPQTQMGPAVSEDQMETSYRSIEVARGEGGRVVTGGERLQMEKPGWYVQPTLIADTEAGMRINNEEIFGPVASTIRVKDYEQALEIANGVEFGLSAGIVTSSLKHARDFQRRAKAGMMSSSSCPSIASSSSFAVGSISASIAVRTSRGKNGRDTRPRLMRCSSPAMVCSVRPAAGSAWIR